MRALADEGFSAVVIAALRAAGHDILWSRDIIPSAPDLQVLKLAQQERRVVLTDDRDYGELIFRLGMNATNGVIYFRLGHLSPEQYLARAMEVAAAISDFANKYYVVGPRVIRGRILQPRSQHP